MAKILIVGEDVALLEIRAAVLRTTGAETAGFGSSTVLSILADRKFDLVVVCYSVEAELRSSLLKLIRVRWPQTRILLISRYGDRDDDAAVDAVSMTDPESLVRNTRKQLRLIEQEAAQLVLPGPPTLPRHPDKITVTKIS